MKITDDTVKPTITRHRYFAVHFVLIWQQLSLAFYIAKAHTDQTTYCRMCFREHGKYIQTILHTSLPQNESVFTF